jgi:very-short-patch-repair endonuclease
MRHQVVIELDGGQHNFDSHAAGDMRRDDRLARDGFRVLRFWNSDVDRNLAGVLEVIDRTLAETCPTRPPKAATLPLRGRD